MASSMGIQRMMGGLSDGSRLSQTCGAGSQKKRHEYPDMFSKSARVREDGSFSLSIAPVLVRHEYLAPQLGQQGQKGGQFTLNFRFRKRVRDNFV